MRRGVVNAKSIKTNPKISSYILGSPVNLFCCVRGKRKAVQAVFAFNTISLRKDTPQICQTTISIEERQSNIKDGYVRSCLIYKSSEVVPLCVTLSNAPILLQPTMQECGDGFSDTTNSHPDSTDPSIWPNWEAETKHCQSREHCVT
jgi:hypothetical protein